MPQYVFGPWTPDLPTAVVADESNVLRLTTAQNVIPSYNCYEPQPDAVAVSGSLSATCQGAFACLDNASAPNWFAGTATNLFRITSNTATWSTVGAGYALTADDRWSFTRYGNTVLAAAPTNDLQAITLVAGASFAAVAGAPRFRHLAIVRNFVVGAGTDTNPQRLQWSAIDNPLSWTIDSVTMADYQDLFGPGGWNTGIVTGLGGADAVVFQEHAIWRMIYVGSPYVFQMDPVENAYGALVNGSIVQAGGIVFYLSYDGFYAFDGVSSAPIGDGKVDSTFLQDVNPTTLSRLSAAADADRHLVMWSYQSNDGSSPDKILVYNHQTGGWSLLTQACELLWRTIALNGTGVPSLAIVNNSHVVANFSGSNKAAIIETAEYQPSEQRLLLTELYPLVEGAYPTTTIAHRYSVFHSSTSTAAISVNSQGFAPLRLNNRLLRIRQDFPAASSWNQLKGCKITAIGVGKR